MWLGAIKSWQNDERHFRSWLHPMEILFDTRANGYILPIQYKETIQPLAQVPNALSRPQQDQWSVRLRCDSFLLDVGGMDPWKERMWHRRRTDETMSVPCESFCSEHVSMQKFDAPTRRHHGTTPFISASTTHVTESFSNFKWLLYT
jgi:hypothetical protein